VTSSGIRIDDSNSGRRLRIVTSLGSIVSVATRAGMHDPLQALAVEAASQPGTLRMFHSSYLLCIPVDARLRIVYLSRTAST